MGKIKAFFYIFFNSLTSVRYYNDLLKTNLAFSIKYFFIISTIGAALYTAATLLPQLPQISQTINTFLEESRELYPQDLIVSSRGGTIEVNRPQPFIIETPKALLEAENGEDLPANLIVFDSNGTMRDLEKYDTWVLVNSTNALFRSTNKIEVYPLSDLPEGEFSIDDYNQIIDSLENTAQIIPAFIGIFAFAGILIYYLIFRLGLLTLVGLILFAIGKARGLKLSYPQFLKIAIHTFTLPLIIELLTTAFGVFVPLPFWFFTLNLIFGIFVVVSLGKQRVFIEPTGQL